MAFTSLSNQTRFNTLPVLIAGPILRRVEKDSVTVFVVTKIDVSCKLKIYDSSSALKFESQIIQSKKIGKNLFINYITASTSSSSNYLNSGQVYRYNVFFPSEGATVSLLSSSITDLSDYLYGENTLPDFVFAPSDINDLTIFHGSCRKPHGEWSDVFLSVDKMINTNIADASLRPNFLFLTGDQIYADDVSDTMLFLIRDAQKKLVDFEEEINVADINKAEAKENLKKSELVIGDNFDTEYNSLNLINSNNKLILDNLIPGIRGPFIHASHLTVDDTFKKSHVNFAKSHLIGLGEFFLMYLFVWSETLWPEAEDFPTFENVYSEKIKKNKKFKSKKVVKFDINTGNTFYASKYKEEESSLKRFAYNLKKIRRAMAHVPVYMLFDDHEITDDCFLNFDWFTKTVQASTFSTNAPTNLSRRIISNGLTALTIFQSFGNFPDYFSSMPLEALEDTLLEYIDDKTRNNASIDFEDLETAMLPELNLSESLRELYFIKSNFDYSFDIHYGNYLILGLDTRTRRGFPIKSNLDPDIKGASALINDGTLGDIIQSVSSELALILTPSPVFGQEILEIVLETSAMAGEPTIENIKEKLDYEAWHYNRHCFELLLQKLGKFNKVIFFSGDVHYASSLEGKYWDERSNPDKYAFVQLTSTSLKNEDKFTKFMSFLPVFSFYHFGWESEGIHVKTLDINKFLSSSSEGTTYEFLSPKLDKLSISKYPYVFDGLTLLADFFKDPVGYIFNKFWSDFENLQEVYNDVKKFVDTIDQKWEWLVKQYTWLNENVTFIIENEIIDNLKADWDYILQKPNNVTWADWMAQRGTYWVENKLTWLEQKFDWLHENWTMLRDYSDEIIEFMSSPPIQFNFPLYIYFQIINYPKWYYSTQSIEDTRGLFQRFDPDLMTDLDSRYDFKDIFNPTPTKLEKYQKLSIFGSLKWDYCGSRVVGNNNMGEVSFIWTNEEQKVINWLWSDPIEYVANNINGIQPKDKEVNNQYFLNKYTLHELSLNEPTEDNKPKVLPDQ